MNIHTLGGLAGPTASLLHDSLFLLNVSGHADRAAPAWKQESGCYGAADVAAAVANAGAGFLGLIRRRKEQSGGAWGGRE